MSNPDRAQLEAAIATAKSDPTSDDAWNEVEDLANELESPDDVANLYRDVLERDLDAKLANEIGERAAQFFEEWYGDDPSKLGDILSRVLVLDPDADWAFERLTLALTEGQKWDRLLDVYDRGIDASSDLGRQVQLLEEAAQVARDMADNSEKAIDYLQRLAKLKPDDDKIAPTLEKLLEKHERWPELIDLWQNMIDDLPVAERTMVRGRIASCYLENLGDPSRGLDIAKDYLAEAEDESEPCALIERILSFDGASADVRDRALDLLRYQYESTDRPMELVRVLDHAIEVDPDREKLYRGEAAALLAEDGQIEAAMNHYAALLALDPSSAATVGNLRQLAQRSQNFALFVDGVAKAAEITESAERKVALLAAGARARLENLDDKTGAIELFQRALATEDISAADILYVGRKLNELLATTERHPERLDVLRKLATAETIDATRKVLIGDIARLSEHLGDAESALSAWRARLELDATDHVALESAISLLEQQEDWEALAATVQQRLEKGVAPDERRSDLIRLARLYRDHLDDVEASLEAWSKVRDEFGESEETVTALIDLFAAREQWKELAELLQTATAATTAALLTRLGQLGDAYRDHLDSSGLALECYDAILRIDPRHEAASEGLQGLLNDEACAERAIEILATNYRNTDGWQGMLELVDSRLERESDPAGQLAILREAAKLHETRGDDLGAAADAIARAFPLAPTDPVLERELNRLAGSSGSWSATIVAYRSAIDAVEDDAARTELSGRLAAILEAEGDAEAALANYQTVAAAEPSDLDATRSIVRLATGLAHYDTACAAVVASAVARHRFDEELFEGLSAAADEDEACRSMAAAFESALNDATDLLSTMARLSALRHLVDWYANRLKDEAAEERLLTVIAALDPTDPTAQGRLAELRRLAPGPDLYFTLRQLTEIDPNNLDLRWEAAQVALEHIDDADEVERAVSSLLNRAAAAWRNTAPATGQKEPSEAVEWAQEHLARRYREAERASAAFELYVDAARLPFSPEKQRAMRIEAATIAANDLGDPASATEMYRTVLAKAPHDSEALLRLGELYRSQDRHAELLNLCQHELDLGADDDRRLELRLEMARLVGEIDKRVDRARALKKNLQERPGHETSIAQLKEILSDKGEFADLINVLSDQAKILEGADRRDEAASLWRDVARVAERELANQRRAIDAHRRVVSIEQDPISFEALAVLHTSLGEPDQAMPWLERLVEVTEKDQSSLILRLARSLIDANQRDRAIEFLARTRRGGEKHPEIRKLLSKLYRYQEQWEPLAELLTDSLNEVDEETAARLARTAAELYQTKLNAPAKALPAIERALASSSEDRELKIMHAKALRAASRLDEAKTCLEELISEYGRRRSKERALLHVELAHVLGQQEDHEPALKEIELASKMDAGNPHLLREVAAMALAGGNLDKAEKSLRSLLLVVRRNPPGDELDAVGESTVLYELHRLAKTRGEEEKSEEFLESAIEAGLQSDAEVRRLTASLLETDDTDLALRALEGRIEVSDSSEGCAELLTALAEILEERKGRHEDGLNRRLEALDRAPKRLDFHDAAIAAARQGGLVQAYVDRVAKNAAAMKRDEDSNIAAALWLRVGSLCENELGDLETARTYYVEASEAGANDSDALFALARVASKTGDTDSARSAIDRLKAMVDDEPSSPEQAGALYQLAELQIESYELRSRGIELLSQALSIDPRPDRAAKILRSALDAEPDDTEILSIYERIARESADRRVLLDFLERQSALPHATAVQIREAVDVAYELGEDDRGDALLERAVDVARSGDEGLAAAAWAAVALCRRRTQEQPDKAKALLEEVADSIDGDDLLALGCEIANVARADDRDLVLAAGVLEMLRERFPNRREVWEPLADVHRRAGNAESFMEVINATLPTLMDPQERNSLRIQTARYLIDDGRANEATSPLRDAILDDPDDLAAIELLEHVLRESGDDEGLADFLWQRFEDARERGNAATLENVALRLGTLLAASDSPDVATVYSAALELSPTSAPLLRRSVERLTDGQEKAELGERLLTVDDEENVSALALELAAMWTELGDEGAALRVLQIGGRRLPTDPALRQRLEDHYRSTENWNELANMIVSEANAIDDPAEATARYRAAAALYREQLADPTRAAETLARACERAPEDAPLAIECAEIMRGADHPVGALELLSKALEGELAPSDRADILLAHAHTHTELGDYGAATASLEEAFSLDSERAWQPLWEGLGRQRSAAAESGARDLERAATLRLAELLAAAEEGQQASDMLSTWVTADPQDREALELLLELDRGAERWSGVVVACSRLVMILHGEAQIESAETLWEAATAAGDSAVAREGLEFVHQVQPENASIRDRLRSLYRDGGLVRELAGLLLADAEQSEDEDKQYEAYRDAADLFVNQLGDPESAIAPAQKAKEIRPDNHDTVVLLADILTVSGRADEAAELLEPAIAGHKRRSPELAQLQYRMARTAQAAGDHDNQLVWLKKAFDVDRKNGIIAAELAQLATELQDYDLALKPLRAISLMDTPGPISRTMALLWEAKIEHARGNRAKAELWAKKALREDPEFAEAQEFLSQIQE